MWNGWVIGVLGVWTFLTPFFDFGMRTYAWNDWIVGLITAVAGFTMVSRRRVEGWVTGVAGAWLFVAGFIPEFLAGTALWWNNILIGVAMILFGFAAVREPERVA